MNMKRLILFGLVLIVAGCSSTRPLKPGKATIRSNVSTNGVHEFVSEMKQPENPAQSAAQNFERTTETELPLAAGSKVVETLTAAPVAAGDQKTLDNPVRNSHLVIQSLEKSSNW